MSKTAVLIPARIGGKRFPGKMLEEIDGKPLIRYVYDKLVEETNNPQHIYVLTDSIEIANVIPFNVLITSSSCINGTERCQEASKILNYDKIINVQGDFVGINAAILKQIESRIKDSTVVTAHSGMPLDYDVHDTVKVIISHGQALWFTREELLYGFKHYGVYGYTPRTLTNYGLLGKAEEIESLEQLRWLENRTKMTIQSVEIDNMIDIDAVTEINNKADMVKLVDALHSK